MDDSEALLSIGTFARRVGLTPSALRFYDDCGVLRPARVDGVTGYRRYGAGQAARAVRLRQLREAGLPLVDVAVVLDGPEDAAHGVLRAHLERMRRNEAEARALVERLLPEAPEGAGHCRAWARARIGGAELASAVRQVAPAAATGKARERHPVLGHVLLELSAGEARLVATDRYRLAVRVLRPTEFEGGPRCVLIGAEAARGLAEWAVRQRTVELECAGDEAEVRLRSGTDVREVPDGCAAGRGGGAEAAAFPDYRLMLEGLEAGRHRLIVDREALRDAVAGRARVVSLSVSGGGTGGGEDAECGRKERVVSRETASGEAAEVSRETAPGAPAEQTLTVSDGGREPVRLRLIAEGSGLRIAFDPAVLLPALEAGVGPDVLLEITSVERPVVVRSADQGSFTTLVMPVRRSGTED
ncbi:MerR family transcriptional regulator [Streptomyces lydicus]|uniref:MerR family transcriptional regulator n=1 Tax=Streptomyces lydicus TaxID=47763 RepID=UPI000980F4A4|nr:MerR family transcriptional regulator [Streptomyces lydicus]